jgi:hypothetical protein
MKSRRPLPEFTDYDLRLLQVFDAVVRGSGFASALRQFYTAHPQVALKVDSASPERVIQSVCVDLPYPQHLLGMEWAQQLRMRVQANTSETQRLLIATGQFVGFLPHASYVMFPKAWCVNTSNGPCGQLSVMTGEMSNRHGGGRGNPLHAVTDKYALKLSNRRKPLNRLAFGVTTGSRSKGHINVILYS